MTMPASAAQPDKTTDSPQSVVLISADAKQAARLLDDFASLHDEQLQLEWVADLGGCIERARVGGVAAIVLDLSLDPGAIEQIFDRLAAAAPNLPIVILIDPATGRMGRLVAERGGHSCLQKREADAPALRAAVRSMMESRAGQAKALKEKGASDAPNSLAEAVFRTDGAGRVTYLNRFAEEMTGWSREEALGRPVADVLRVSDGAESEALNEAVAEVVRCDLGAPTPIRTVHSVLARRDGSRIPAESRVAMVDRSEDIGAAIASRDVSSALAASIEASRLAERDMLTDLPNRTLFNDRLGQAIALAERERKQLALLFVDLDQFKRINDSLGHSVGDRLLQSVAARLTKCVRGADTVCRWGGDEFVVLLSPVAREEDAAVIARKLLRSLAAPHLIDNKSVEIHASIGGSTYPRDAHDAAALMSQADSAMYEAKRSGRNQYSFWRRDMRELMEQKLLLEGDLRYALGRKEFLLHYQPKINLDTGEITGMEALIRWLRPGHGLQTPMSFVPVAEECGLIAGIGQWVLLEACRQSRAWSDAGFGVAPVAVNVSAAEFRGKDFLAGIRAALIATGLDPENLELELTESVLMNDAESAVTTLRALKAMGVRLAIDDFGTGYSSFTYLQRFPVDTLKVDRSFVNEITADLDEATLVSAMIGIGHSLKKRIVAEGVETREQVMFLQRHGCAQAQGYYFSRPVAAEKAGRLFRDGLPTSAIGPFARSGRSA